jgi:hypothetical protein
VVDSYLIDDAESVIARVRAGPGGARGVVSLVRDAGANGPADLPHGRGRRRRPAGDLLEVYRSIGQYRGDGSLWGWVRGSPRQGADAARRNKYRDTDELHDEVHAFRKEDTPLRMDLEAALDRLPEVSRRSSLRDVGDTRTRNRRDDGKDLSFSSLARAGACEAPSLAREEAVA